MNLANRDPNFSIVVPGPCNAKCAFCFWKPETSSKESYLTALRETLRRLPHEFQQCSITGGEPTASNVLPDILPLARKRFPKMVLSSNEFDLLGAFDVFPFIDHLNVFRHHWGEGPNIRAFGGTTSVPSEAEIGIICQRAHKANVDVTLNCVLPEGFDDPNFIAQYIVFAQNVGADGVCFRKEHGTLDDLPVESKLSGLVLRENGCPVCRTKERFLFGMKTTWRYGVLEPTKIISPLTIYELVLQQDGTLTSDWEGQYPVTLPYQRRTTVAPPVNSTYQGCSMSCGGTNYCGMSTPTQHTGSCGLAPVLSCGTLTSTQHTGSCGVSGGSCGNMGGC